MLFIFILFFLFIILSNSLTTIPFSIAMLIVCAVIFRKPWVFFAGFLLGLLFDLFFVRSLGLTGLILTFIVFLVLLYERKFETQTLTFVFVLTFLGSLIYLWFFKYEMVFIQAFINALLSVLLFRVMLNSFQHLNKTRS